MHAIFESPQGPKVTTCRLPLLIPVLCPSSTSQPRDRAVLVTWPRHCTHNLHFGVSHLKHPYGMEHCPSWAAAHLDPSCNPVPWQRTSSSSLQHTTTPRKSRTLPFFALAAYNSSLLNAFNPATYSGNSTAINVIDPTNEVYITSAIQWQHSDQNWITGSGYYVEEWDFDVSANGSLTGSCTIDEDDDTLNACGTLKFPTGFNDPFNCTGSFPTNFATLYDIENSTVDATLGDDSGAVSIRGITPNGVHAVLNFSGTFWPNSTAFSQLGIQEEHAVAPATSTNVWLYKPTSTAGASKGTKQTTKPNAATRVEAMQFGLYGRAFLSLFGVC